MHSLAQYNWRSQVMSLFIQQRWNVPDMTQNTLRDVCYQAHVIEIRYGSFRSERFSWDLKLGTMRIYFNSTFFVFGKVKVSAIDSFLGNATISGNIELGGSDTKRTLMLFWYWWWFTRELDFLLIKRSLTISLSVTAVLIIRGSKFGGG